MNIYSLIRTTIEGYSPRNQQTDTPRSAPRASTPPKGPHAINFARNDEKSLAPNSTARGAKAEDISQVLRGVMGLFSALINDIKTLLGSLDQNSTKPDKQPTNPAKPSPNPHTVSNDTPTKRVEEPSQHRTKRNAQPLNPNTSGYNPEVTNTYRPADLVSGFSQKRGTMNCVTIAGIKAAMQRFGGPKEVYSSVERTKDGYDVKMRDNPNKTFRITQAELNYATQHSGFSGNNQKMLNDANFMYAVSAKRAQLENNDGYASHSFAAAVKSLDSWEHTQEGLNRLGLKNHVQRTTARELANGAPGVMDQNNHVFTVFNGRADDYGRLGNRPTPWAHALKLV